FPREREKSKRTQMQLRVDVDDARQRRRHRVEPQVFSNAGVQQGSGRKPTQHSQAVGERTGRVPELRASRGGSLQYDVGYDTRVVCSFCYRFESLAQGRTNIAILIELRVGFQEVRVEGRLRVGGLDDRDPDASCTQLMVNRFRVAFDRVLGRGIDRQVGRRQEAK